MHCVIYSFKVKSNCEVDFVTGWKALNLGKKKLLNMKVA